MAESTAGAATALEALEAVTRKLRRECPWDRTQDERSIVPHTVEEAYELAEAAHSGDDARLLDELGDVLFQVLFLAMLMEERGAGNLAAVADHCREKLIRRHPHVFGDLQVAGADEVVRNWDRIKREEGAPEGVFGGVPENLPALLYARKVARRDEAAPDGRRDQAAPDRRNDEAAPDGPGREPEGLEAALARVRAGAESAARAPGGQERFEALGELLLWVVEVARRLEVDPELALRAAADRRSTPAARDRPMSQPGPGWARTR